MILERGTKLLICHRRLFAEDQPRFFMGVVQVCDGSLARVSGYSWVRDPFSGDFMRSAGERTKVFSLVSGSLIVYRLPATCVLDDLAFAHLPDQSLTLFDGHGFEMDLTERYSHVHPPGERRAS